MTYDEMLDKVIELADEGTELFKDLQFIESAWGSDDYIEGLMSRLQHAKTKAERIKHSREVYKLDRMNGEVIK